MVYNSQNAELPPMPKDLQTAVKDYLAWMRDVKRPINHPNFDEVKRRVIHEACEAIARGTFCTDERSKS